MSTLETSFFSLQGKRILVTGASAGIGRVVAQVLAQLGAHLILNGRNLTALQETHASLAGDKNLHIVSPLDLADLERIPAWVKETVKLCGTPLSGLVHAAGIGGITPLRGMTRQQIDSVMIPNLYASLFLIRAASAFGVVAEQSSFVMLSSVAAMGSKGMAAYGASKAALESVVRSAALELAEKKIRVNGIAPGYVKTPMYEQISEQLPGQLANMNRQFLGFVDPKEIGYMAAFLLGDACRSVTGTIMRVDGGYSL